MGSESVGDLRARLAFAEMAITKAMTAQQEGLNS
jgi:hypothetical protein